MELESGAPVSALEALCAGAELVGEVREPLLPLVQVAQQRRIRLQETVLRHLCDLMTAAAAAAAVDPTLCPERD